MKPGPFDDVDFNDPKTHFKLKSFQKRYNPDKEALTEVFEPKGKKLWSMNIFTGRHKINLSHEAKFLILSGDYHFETQISLSQKAHIATVIDEGKEIKKIIFSDLFTEDPLQMAKDRDLRYKGGNWADESDFIKKMDIDWKQKNMSFTLFDNSIKKFSF